MSETADIVIIGGGIIGMSAAFQIARRSKVKIIVLDKGAGPGEGSTGASSAVCRFKYTHDNTVRLARDGINAYRNWPAFLEIERPIAKFQNDGVLWLSDGQTDWPERDVRRLAGLGVNAQTLDDADLSARFPALNPCIRSPDFATEEPHTCRGGGLHLFEQDGGYIDPVSALQDLIAACRGKGVSVRFKANAADIIKNGESITGVRLADGDEIACNVVVNTAGPWCADIYRQAGLDNPWPLRPTRIQMIHIERPAKIVGAIPATVDPVAGIYFRTQNNGQQIIVGSVREEDERETIDNPDDLPDFVDDDFAREKLFALEHRLPGLSIHGLRGYCGLYTVNQIDVHPVVGLTAIKGFYVANGMSGHGFKLAPAIGALLAREIVGPVADFDTDVDPSFLAFDRDPINISAKNVLA